MKTRIDLRLRRIENQTIWFGCVLLSVAMTVEILGRRGTSDLHDGVAMATLFTLMVGGYILMGKRALAWAKPLRAVSQRLLDRLRNRKFDVGIDLRQSPPVPTETPTLIRDLLFTVSALGVILVVMAAAGGPDIRSITTAILYIGHLVGLFAVWTLLLFTIATSFLLPTACIHDAFACRYVGPKPRPRKLEWLTIGVYFAVVLLMGLTLPIWIPAAMCALSLSLFLAMMWRRSTPSVTLLWRGPRSEGIRAMDWRDYETACAVIVAVAFIDLLLISIGGAAIGLGEVDRTAMPVTTTLGTLAAWLGGCALTAGGGFATGWISAQRRRDPSQPCPTTLHVRGKVKDPKRLLEIFRARGWRARFASHQQEQHDVPIELVESMPPLRGRWPMPVSMKGLEMGELQQVLARRDEIQRRRTLMRGLERLFKKAAQRSFGRGQGFWIAPHYWYISGLTRDVDEDRNDLGDGTVISGVIGPSYHRIIPRPARNHLHEILRALEVDRIFLEDGVGYRGFRRVLRVLFEQYDIHGGRQRLEERHLQGVPGLRAILHEYELGNPLRKKGYPEPGYETLGRARILHIFKDRGEHEEPVSGEDVPVPLLFG